MLPWLYVLDHCHAGRPARDPKSVFLLRKDLNRFEQIEHGSVHWPLDVMKLCRNRCTKTAPKQNVSTSMLDCGNGVLSVILAFFFILQTRRVELLPNSSTSVSSDHKVFSQTFSESFDIQWQTLKAGLYMYLLEQDDLVATVRFQTITTSCVTNWFPGD